MSERLQGEPLRREPLQREPLRIVSGGQTGVDRGALDAALALGVLHGGWCPRGRRAEDGEIPAHYRLLETASANYAVRTEQNVLDSQGTLVLHRGPLAGGTALTVRLARQHGRPCLLVDLLKPPPPSHVVGWLARHAIRVLNVAGPRESGAAGIQHQSCEYLQEVLQEALSQLPP